MVNAQIKDTGLGNCMILKYIRGQQKLSVIFVIMHCLVTKVIFYYPIINMKDKGGYRVDRNLRDT